MIYALLSLIHICRDLRAFGGTSLDPNFLVGGPKSIYTTGGYRMDNLDHLCYFQCFISNKWGDKTIILGGPRVFGPHKQNLRGQKNNFYLI